MQLKPRADKISGNDDAVTNASPASGWSKAEAIQEQVRCNSCVATRFLEVFQIWAKMPEPTRARILVQCIVTKILMLSAIKQLSTYRSVKKNPFSWFPVEDIPKI